MDLVKAETDLLGSLPRVQGIGQSEHGKIMRPAFYVGGARPAQKL